MGFPVLSPWENVEDADWLHLSGDEEVQWTGRPSRFTIALSVLGGLVLALVGVGLSFSLGNWMGDAGVPGWLRYIPLVLTVVGIVWVGRVYLDWIRLLYVVTDEEIYVKYGLVSRDVTQVRLNRVQNTAFEQSVLGRILRYGDVRIYTAGTGTEDVVFQSVPNPHQVMQTLTNLLDDSGDTGLKDNRFEESRSR